MKKLSMRSSFPLLHAWEQMHGSLFKGAFKAPKSPLKGLFTLRSGVKRLIEALGNLPIKVHCNTPVQELTADGVMAGGHFFAADQIISALPAPEISRLTQIPISIRYESMHVVNFGFKGNVLPLKGYGYLIPATENEELLGMIWDSAIFPVSGQTKVTAMVRSHDPLAAALSAMERHLGVKQPPEAVLVTRAEIPQSEVGHSQRIQEFEATIKSRYPKMRLVGNYYLGGASVEGCLEGAERVGVLSLAL
jgi:oxygen-dependent protoporphyrinogen oxidase